MRILIARTGEALPAIRAERGDFDRWFEAGLGVRCDVLDVTDDAALPTNSEHAGIVVTGSAAMVSSGEPWMLRASRWLRDQAERVPVLGVCFGHQLLGHAFGGTVGRNPRGRQIGTVEMRLDAQADPLLDVLPNRLCVQTTHQEVILVPPPRTEVLGATALDPHHVIRFGPRCWGVQFHPEFDASITAAYIRELSDGLVSEGLDPGALTESVRPTPLAASVLERFAEFARRSWKARGGAGKGDDGAARKAEGAAGRL